MKNKMVFMMIVMLGISMTTLWGSGLISVADAALAAPVRQTVETLVTYILNRGGKHASAELTKLGGNAGVRRLVERAAREGGDEAVSSLARLTRAHGIYALRAAENASHIPGFIRAVDGLPQNMTGRALRRLSGPDGKTLARMMDRHGPIALRAEAAHPGIGIRAMHSLGSDGAVLVTKMSRDQAITTGRHLGDIARLPADRKQDILHILHNDMERMVTLMGRFIEKNPGKVLFTAATTTIILQNSEKILGGGAIEYDTTGNPVFVKKPGLVERVLNPAVSGLINATVLPIILGLFLLFSIKLWFSYKRSKLKHKQWLNEN